MFSVKHRQMEELNSGQSFGRAGNDLNLLAQPETVKDCISGKPPQAVGGALSWSPRAAGSLKLELRKQGQNVQSKQKEKAGSEWDLGRKGGGSWKEGRN